MYKYSIGNVIYTNEYGLGVIEDIKEINNVVTVFVTYFPGLDKKVNVFYGEIGGEI